MRLRSGAAQFNQGGPCFGQCALRIEQLEERSASAAIRLLRLLIRSRRCGHHLLAHRPKLNARGFVVAPHLHQPPQEIILHRDPLLPGAQDRESPRKEVAPSIVPERQCYPCADFKDSF